MISDQLLHRYHFTYPGLVVPYVRMTQRSKFVNEKARTYLASKDNIRMAIRLQMMNHGWEPMPAKTPFLVKIVFRRMNLYTCDLDNLAKAVLDAMNGIVFDDDRYCVTLEAGKGRGEDYFNAYLEART